MLYKSMYNFGIIAITKNLSSTWKPISYVEFLRISKTSEDHL